MLFGAIVRVQDRSVAEFCGMGVFIMELELELADGRAVLAVLSL